MKNPKEHLRLETVADLEQVNYWLKKSNLPSIDHEDVFAGLVIEHRNEHLDHSEFKLVMEVPGSGLLRDCIIIDTMKLSRAGWHLFDDWFKVFVPVNQPVSTRAQAIGLARNESVGLMGVSVGYRYFAADNLRTIASAIWFSDEADAVNYEMNVHPKIKWLKTV